MNITLIGMPGSGKSYVGERLAEKLGYALLEIDKVIEAEYGLPLQAIVDKMGAHDFLDVEAARIVENCKGKDNLVISPGGSMIYRETAMEYLKANSKIVYLKASTDTLMKRIAGVPRGVVNPGGLSFEDLHTERSKLYEKWADATVDGNAEPDAVVQEIMRSLPIKALV